MLSMTRIIGGLAGSLKLAAPAKVTRPTSDRVRESIFNRLEARELLDGANVLDLYAGTGALGLEAISRGARNLVMVEKDPKAAAVCSANANLLSKLPVGEIAVFQTGVSTFLNGTTRETDFDLIFIDPPYEISNAEVSRNLQDLFRLLGEDAVIVLERSSRDNPVEVPAGLELTDQKNYGDTTVYWLAKTISDYT